MHVHAVVDSTRELRISVALCFATITCHRQQQATPRRCPQHAHALHSVFTATEQGLAQAPSPDFLPLLQRLSARHAMRAGTGRPSCVRAGRRYESRPAAALGKQATTWLATGRKSLVTAELLRVGSGARARLPVPAVELIQMSRSFLRSCGAGLCPAGGAIQSCGWSAARWCGASRRIAGRFPAVRRR